MPDLSHVGAVGWLAARDPDALPLAGAGPADQDPDTAALVERLGVLLDGIGQAEASARLVADADLADRLARAMAQFGLASRLALLEWLEPPAAHAVLDAPAAGFLRDELGALARRGLAARVVSADRLADLKMAIEGMEDP